MKRFLYVTIVLACSFMSYAQSTTPSEHLNIDLSLKVIKAHNVTHITIPFKENPKRNKVPLDYWSPKKHNPFKEHLITYPFKITFNDTTFHSPIRRNKVITSRYGWRRGRAHKGIDIDLITGDSVFAVLDGVVRLSKYSGGFGRAIVIRHENHIETTYAHLSKLVVKPNDLVKKGQLIGFGGNTGRSRGSHLHFEMSYYGVAINPEYFFDFDASNKIKANTLWVTQKWTQPLFHNSRKPSKIELLTSESDALNSLQKKPQLYIVKRGDTLSEISRKTQIPMAAICKLNKIKRHSTLRIGQRLIIAI